MRSCEVMLRYSELINFEPVESVVQLKDANDARRAEQLLSTYVISENMANKITDEIIENLQFERQVDNKGMLIVGNYGTGKSHLMSVISTIAEIDGASVHLRNAVVSDKAKEIEGKFKVIRAEFGAVTMSLRDIICRELERGLEDMGIDFSFPPASEVTNNKDMFFEMMELFNEEYPEKGLLLVIDELLDYLRGRKDQELVLDLGFLREVGEVCSKSRFRFISGVQEMLFDNPKFSFVADSLRRVKERFREVRIVREDIAFVVSERLLKKNDEQKALIREHLKKFTKMYNGLNENLEHFVSMFPIHPDYLETFEKVSINEKRVALQTISSEMKKLLNEPVPEEETGFVSFDRYWGYIEADSSLRTNDNVRLVMNKLQTLKNCIQNTVRRQYKPIANQLVNALAVYRLTTDDLKTPIGLTSEALRDELFVSHPMLLEMGEDAEFLLLQIETALNEVRKAASFQFLSQNEANGQYYIDVDKAMAVDDLIKDRGESLNDNQLDRYYFQVLKQATEVTSQKEYVDGYKIWLHEIPWKSHMVKREGYLFFGAPNERSTAQPERDFYIYMLQPFEEPKFKDEEKEDEIFFRLVKKDDNFVNLLRLYGGASEMYNDTATNRHLYKPKMEENFKKLVQWLRNNFLDAYEIVYRGGKPQTVREYGIFSQPETLIDAIDTVAQEKLSVYFEMKYKDYPKFKVSVPIAKGSIHTYATDALRYLNGMKTNQGEVVLKAFNLIDNKGKLTTQNSIYAQWVLDLLNQKTNGQVLNQNELIEVISTVQGTDDQRLTKEFRLEPEWLVVVLGALIQSAEIVVTLNGKTYEAINYSDFIQTKINDLTYFTHIKKPTGLPINAVQALIDMFNAPTVNFSNPNSVDVAIKDIITKAKEETNKVIKMIGTVQNKFQIWDGQIFTNSEKEERIASLKSLSEFLQGIQRYDTRAKMNNLAYDVQKIAAEAENLKLVHQLNSLQQKITEINPIAQYLERARLIATPGREWNDNTSLALENLSDALKAHEDCVKEISVLNELKEQYIQHYMKLHQESRLTATENRQKSTLINDPRTKALQLLTREVELLSAQSFKDWNSKLGSLQVCFNLTPQEMQHSPECPHCHFTTREERTIARLKLKELQDQLNQMMETSTETLLTTFNDPDVKDSINYLDSQQKKLITQLITDKKFELPINPNLITAINTVLKGIQKEQVEVERLLSVFGNGNPITVDEARRNFDLLLRELVGNKDKSSVRLEVKKDNQE